MKAYGVWRALLVGVLLGLGAGSAGHMLAQVPQAAGYAGEPLVIEELSTVYQFAADGTGSKMLHVKARAQSQAAATQLGVLNISYAAAGQTVELKSLHVLKADGTVIETKAEDAQDMPAEVTRLAPVYSDLRQKQYPVRGMGVGDTLEYEAVVRTTKPEVPGQFWGAENFAVGAVVLRQTLELRVPAAVHVTESSPRHTPKVSTEGGERVFRWEWSQLKPTVGAEAAAKNQAAGEDEAASGLPDVAWTSFADWTAVGAWYGGLATPRAEATPEIKAKADALAAGASSEEEKARREYAFVSEQIRYVGVGFGVGRYQPHTAAEVLANGYGDCKDKDALLRALLKAEGMDAEPVLIGSGIKFDPHMPAPMEFNHLITLGTVAGKPVWMDATEEVAPFGALMLGLRGKDALVVAAGAGPSHLEKTPAALPFAAEDQWEVKAKLDAAWKLTGRFDIRLRGDSELAMRWGLRQVTAAQWDEYGQNVSRALGYAGTVTHFAPEKPEASGTPLHYTYDYDRPDFGDANERTIFTLLTPSLFSLFELEKKPADPIELAGPRVERVRSEIELPEGWNVATLPSPVHVQASYGSYNLSYRLVGHTLVSEGTLKLTAATVPADGWEDYNRFAKELRESTETTVKLNAGSGAVAEAATGAKPDAATEAKPDAGAIGGKAEARPEAVDNVEAQHLLEDGYKLLSQGDLAGTRAKLDEAGRLNGNQRGLWALRGLLAARENRVDEAESAYRKELALEPENEGVLDLLARLLVHEKKRAEAIEVEKQLLKAKGGSDPATVLALSQQLNEAGRYGESLPLLQRAALKSSGNKLLQLQLGMTELAAGREAEAVATLETALDGADEPGVLNNAAYQLSLHSKEDLPLAEKSARKALALMDEQDRKLSLDTLKPADYGRMQLLTATWDTLGWILFREGNASEAESYAEASWASTQRPEVGYHLGQIREELGNKAGAAHAYAKALAMSAGPASFEGEKDLEARAHTLGASVAGAAELSGERSYKLPLVTRAEGSGTVDLLIEGGKLQGLHVEEDAPALKAAEPKLTGAAAAALAAPGRDALTPGIAGARVVRQGILFCSPLLKSCSLTLVAAGDARPGAVKTDKVTLVVAPPQP